MMGSTKMQHRYQVTWADGEAAPPHNAGRVIEEEVGHEQSDGNDGAGRCLSSPHIQ